MTGTPFPISRRRDAKRAGLIYYFTGKPCKHGHIAQRQAVNGACAECSRIRAAERSRRLCAADPEGMRAKRRLGAKPDAGKQRVRNQKWRSLNGARKKKYDADYYLANADKIRKRASIYHHSNVGRAAGRSKTWRLNNVEQVVANARKSRVRRRARERSVAFEPFTLDDVILRDGPDCYICGITTLVSAPPQAFNKAELEHVIPISRGGSHTPDNLRCACSRCNRIKGSTLTPEQAKAIVFSRAAATRPSHALVLVGAASHAGA